MDKFMADSDEGEGKMEESRYRYLKTMAITFAILGVIVCIVCLIAGVLTIMYP